MDMGGMGESIDVAFPILFGSHFNDVGMEWKHCSPGSGNIKDVVYDLVVDLWVFNISKYLSSIIFSNIFLPHVFSIGMVESQLKCVIVFYQVSQS